MGKEPGGRVSKLRAAVATALTGPQVLGFVPALILAAYWLGGESAMIATALSLPAAILVLGALSGASASRKQPRDSETGLALRRQAENLLTHALLAEQNTGRTVAAIAVDLDEFDSVEQQFGSRAANTLLRQAAERLESLVRDTDVIVRLAGHRFGIAIGPMARADLETMIQLCARLQAELAEPFVIDATRIYVTASAGFALPGRVPSRNGDTMLHCAEQALDEARANGPASIRAYSPQLSRRTEERRKLSGEVAAALENGQICPWFQPQISTHTGRITGFEALPHWHHPDRGPVAAADFVQSIGPQGCGERLSEVLLSGALRALQGWDKAGLAVPGISVAFDSARLSDPKIADKVLWETDRFGLDPDRLFVEIHEDVVAAAPDDMIVANIARLAELGCRIDLDDFGTGHASITNIRRFAVNRIKIDKSFVARVDRDREQQNMVSAVLTMAERLSLDTIAEGVETAGEHAMLAQLGCNSVQGSSVARPMGFDETILWITEHNARLAELSTLRPGSV